MNLVVIKVLTMGSSVAEDDVYFVGAQRLSAESGRVDASFGTYVKTERVGYAAYMDQWGLTDLTEADFESLPTVAEALLELSRFAGTDVIITHDGPVRDIPVIREKCARHGLRVRPVRILDSADMIRKLLGEDTKVNIRELAKRFRLIDDQTAWLGPEGSLKMLGEVVQRLWALLAPDCGHFPVPCGHGVLPALEPQQSL